MRSSFDLLEGLLIDAAIAPIIAIIIIKPPIPLIIGHINIVDPLERLKKKKNSNPNINNMITAAAIAPPALFLQHRLR
jgi:hypothetical protein